MRDKILQEKESTAIMSNNSNKLLGIRQQGDVFTCAIGQISKTAIAAGLDPVGLGRWN